MDGKKVFAQNEKELGDPDTNKRNVEPGCRNGICHWKMSHAHYEKGEEEKHRKKQK